MLVVKITDSKAKLTMDEGVTPKDVVASLTEVIKTLINDYCYTNKQEMVDSVARHLIKGKSNITIH